MAFLLPFFLSCLFKFVWAIEALFGFAARVDECVGMCLLLS
jgi:hypothetical protein